MKFVCIADMHSQYEKLILPEADALIIAGDIGLWKEANADRFDDWLAEQPFTHKIIVGGNHDKLLAEKGSMYLEDCLYLEDSGIDLGGIKIWGSPYTPTFNDWYFMASRGEEIRAHWNLIPDDTDILITHGPPKGALDTINPTSVKYQDESQSDLELGCEELRKAVDRINPKYHIFGHIHGSHGTCSIYSLKDGKKENTTFINCSVVNENYNVVNKPMEFEITTVMDKYRTPKYGEESYKSPWDKEWDGSYC